MSLYDASEILSGIQNATVEELRQLNGAIVEIIRARQREEDAKATMGWQIGDKVQFKGRRNRVLTGTIEKINRTNILVKVVGPRLFGGSVEETTRWNVHASALRTVEEKQ